MRSLYVVFHPLYSTLQMEGAQLPLGEKTCLHVCVAKRYAHRSHIRVVGAVQDGGIRLESQLQAQVLAGIDDSIGFN
jgi:hypothetical protein